ncbi:MAG TPA: hypothetical protein VMV94_20845 [Phycisphaerae bacterium]|nr:hypothetical protein [Phycisphaerae bacterium]
MNSMHTGPPIRRLLKWTGLAVCWVILLGLFRSDCDWPRDVYFYPILVTVAITTAFLFWKDQQYGVFAVLVGVLTYSCMLASLMWWMGLGWRRPVQDWMVAHGVGAYAGHYGLFDCFIPEIILNLFGGAFVGLCCFRRWPRYALLAGATNFAIGYVSFIQDGSPFSMLVLYHLMIIPFAICGAWLAPGRRRRYKAWLAAEGFCKTCGYNLTGNTSGRCPECGTAIPPGVKKAGASNEGHQPE